MSAHTPASVTTSAMPPISAGLDRKRPQAVASDGRGDLFLALLGLQRAGAIDQRAAGLQPGDGAVDHRRLPGGEALDVLRPLQPGGIRVAADGAGRRAGRVEQDGVEGLRRLPGEEVGGDDIGREVEPGEVGGQALEALRRRCRPP